MSKRTTFTTISPLPLGITREAVISFLHDHQEMIDLNPLVIDRHRIEPPPHAPEDELHCKWWRMTDKITYMPGVKGGITYHAAFHDLHNGIQTHCYAPMGTHLRERWTLNGTLPGEPLEPIELGIGAPRQGLYLREDVEIRCNILMASFVKKTMKKAHGKLVTRLKEKALQHPSYDVYGVPHSLTQAISEKAMDEHSNATPLHPALAYSQQHSRNSSRSSENSAGPNTNFSRPYHRHGASLQPAQAWGQPYYVNQRAAASETSLVPEPLQVVPGRETRARSREDPGRSNWAESDGQMQTRTQGRQGRQGLEGQSRYQSSAAQPPQIPPLRFGGYGQGPPGQIREPRPQVAELHG